MSASALPDLDAPGVVWERSPAAEPDTSGPTRILTIPQIESLPARYVSLRATVSDSPDPRLRPKVLARPLEPDHWCARALTEDERATLAPGLATLLALTDLGPDAVEARRLQRGDVLLSPRGRPRRAWVVWDTDASAPVQARELFHRLFDETRPGEHLLRHPQSLGVSTPATMAVSSDVTDLDLTSMVRTGRLADVDLTALPAPTGERTFELPAGTWVLDSSSGRLAPALVWRVEESGVTLVPGRVDRGRDRASDELALGPGDVTGSERPLSVFNRAPHVLSHAQALRSLRRTVGTLTDLGRDRVHAHLETDRLPALTGTLPRGVVLDVLNHRGHLTPEVLFSELGLGDSQQLVTAPLFLSPRPWAEPLGPVEGDGHDGPVWISTRTRRIARGDLVAVRGQLHGEALADFTSHVITGLGPLEPGSVLWAPVVFSGDSRSKVRPLVVLARNGDEVTTLVGSSSARATTHFARTSVQLNDWSQRVTWVRATRVTLDLRIHSFSSDHQRLSPRDVGQIQDLAARTQELGLRASAVLAS